MTTPASTAARALIHEAGALAGEYFARIAELEVHSKGAQDVVTEADVEVELLLKRGWPSGSPTTRSSARRPAPPSSRPPAASGSSTRSTGRSRS